MILTPNESILVFAPLTSLLPPEVYSLSHQNSSKSLALTSDLVRALFVCLHPPYGTQFLTALFLRIANSVSETSQTTLFPIGILCRPLATYFPTRPIQLFCFLALYKSIYLLTYLLTYLLRPVQQQELQF